MRSQVFVVSSPLQGVGKTFIGRLLAEFFLADSRPVECFDLGATAPTLAEYLPELTTRSSIADTRGQMALFDRLMRRGGPAKIVDLGHGLFEQFFTVVAQVGLADEARQQRVQVVDLFIASPSPVAAQAYAILQRWLPGLVLVPVHNELLGRTLPRDKYPTLGAGVLPSRIPLLAPGLRRIVNDASFSFSHFRSGQSQVISDAYRMEIESWMKRAFVEFRELELRLLLATLRMSLSPGRPGPHEPRAGGTGISHHL